MYNRYCNKASYSVGLGNKEVYTSLDGPSLFKLVNKDKKVIHR